MRRKRMCQCVDVAVDRNAVNAVARLIRTRNVADAELAGIIGRPPLPGHLGEWLAQQIFGIQLEHSATAKAIDGQFGPGPLQGKTVNVKVYGKREGLLDLTSDDRLDYYLVFTGPRSAAMTSRGATRPFVITNCYLFDSHHLLSEQRTRGVAIGVASSIPAGLWQGAELYPVNRCGLLDVNAEQVELLALFAPPE